MTKINKEKKRINAVSNWYLDDQLDFDRKLIEFRYRNLKPFLKGPRGLELGSAEGQMTKFLINDFESLTVVDGALDLLKLIPDAPNIVKIHSLFEEFHPEKKYNTIILEHVLEHVDRPVEILKTAKNWLEPGNNFLMLGVPNANSFHRLAAVKMGLLKNKIDLNDRDIAQGHRRVYTPNTLRIHIEKSGLEIVKIGGTFFKPISNGQIQENWTNEMIEGFYKLGNDFPENTADIYAICKVR